MLALLDIIEKVASSASATVPACDSAEAHKRVDGRTKNKVMPWARGRKPMPRKKAGAARRVICKECSELDRQRVKRILEAKRCSVSPCVIKAAELTYADLGQQPMHPGVRGFNRLVGLGLKTMPQSSFGSRLGRGLRAMRSSPTGSSASAASATGAATPPAQSAQPGFWGLLRRGQFGRAFDTTANKMRDMSLPQRLAWSAEMGVNALPIGRGTALARYGTSAGLSALGEGATGAQGMSPTFSRGPGFFETTAATALSPVMAGTAVRDAWRARRANRAAAETDPVKQRMNSFRRWMDDYGHDPEVIEANLPRMFPDLWRRWQSGERW